MQTKTKRASFSRTKRRSSAARRGSASKSARRSSRHMTMSNRRSSLRASGTTSMRRNSTANRNARNARRPFNFHTLFLKELKDMYDAENQLLVALPKAAKAALTTELKEAIQQHDKETKNQVKRLEKIFTMLGEVPRRETCKAMKGLIQEMNDIINSNPKSEVRDAAIIAAAQRIEHYEISSYGTARTFAKQLDYDDAADLLDETLDEESNADKTLTSIAEGGFFTAGINKLASER